MSKREQILEILARVAGSDEVRSQPDLPLYDLQLLDSLRTVELVVAFASELGVEVSPAELEREEWATPGKVAAYIERKWGHSSFHRSGPRKD